MSQLLVIGSINTDLVVRAPRLPGPGETVLGGEFATFAGGKGANQAVAAARAGAGVAFVGCVGDDAFGRERVAGLAAEGIDVSGLRTVPGESTGTALIVIDQATAENQITVASGANLMVSQEDVERIDFARFGAVVLQLEIPVETVKAALVRARAAGCATILNPAPAAPLGRDLLALVDVLIPNEHELALLAGADSGQAEGIASLRALGVGAVIVTRGARGALVADGSRAEEIPAVPVTAVDTVGAGDCFVGGLAAMLAAGRTLHEAVDYARHAAAVAVTRHGAQTAMPQHAEVTEMMRRSG